MDPELRVGDCGLGLACETHSSIVFSKEAQETPPSLRDGKHICEQSAYVHGNLYGCPAL